MSNTILLCALFALGCSYRPQDEVCQKALQAQWHLQYDIHRCAADACVKWHVESAAALEAECVRQKR